jgi:hypothetical protein
VNYPDDVFIVLEIPPGTARAVFTIQWCARTKPELGCRNRSHEFVYDPASYADAGGNAKWKRVLLPPFLPQFEAKTDRTLDVHVKTGVSYITVTLNGEIVGQSEQIQIVEEKTEKKP